MNDSDFRKLITIVSCSVLILFVLTTLFKVLYFVRNSEETEPPNRIISHSTSHEYVPRQGTLDEGLPYRNGERKKP